MLCWHCVVEGLDQEGQMWRDIKTKQKAVAREKGRDVKNMRKR